jgi:xylan 1,4-beta-xylosidase
VWLQVMMKRRDFLATAGAGVVSSWAHSAPADAAVSLNTASVSVQLDLTKLAGTLPHYWENVVGSDRAVVGLREQWRRDLERVHHETGMKAVRCHGLFDDEMGVAQAGPGAFNFLYVDEIYDRMLDLGVRPFVELSFMPEALASSRNSIFAYRGNVSPPRHWEEWRDMVQAFTDHCVKRYGIGEVSSWKFEVWNEPNISFWAGSQDDYFELFRQSVMAVKAVDSRLQVGGPATARVEWIPDLIKYCSAKGVPRDFITTHIYALDSQRQLFGKDNAYPLEQVIPHAVRLAKDQIESSAMPSLPLWITEWSSQNPAFIADTIKNCNGLAETMAYWTFSNAFEETGVPRGVFNTTFGMLDQWGIARPSLHTFALLHKLGDRQIQASEGPVLATRRPDGSTAILVWNVVPATGMDAFANGNPIAAGGGSVKEDGRQLRIDLALYGLGDHRRARLSQVNQAVGSAIPAWHAMGSPRYPSREQLSQLRAAAELPKPETIAARPGQPPTISIDLPPNGVALLEFDR